MNPFVRIALAGAFLLLTSVAPARAAAPTFGTFPVHEGFEGPVHPVRLLSKQDKEFQTALADAASRSANFAGHYVLTTIGCGASCVLVAAIDATSGRVAWLPFNLCCWDPALTAPVLFRLDSDLIIVHGQRNEAGGAGPHYYRLTKNHFVQVHSTPPH
ncbi:MAG: hypothetical protein V4463_18010 [Pseudomonadota bacterium]